MSYDYLNILGKVDASRSVVTPESFQFKLKEALTLNNVDYEKLKEILKDPAIKPSEAWLENEKDKRFQSLFESLWPNLYKNFEEKKAAEAAEAQKQKYVCSLLIDQEVKKYEELLKSKLALSQTTPAAVTSSYPLDACFSTTKLSATPSFTTTITTTTCKCVPTTPTETIKYPNNLSSYDFPYNTRKYVDDIVKSSYNSEILSKETELLKSVIESQDKLKFRQKLEKTTDIVDDIITKVGALQTEMRKKSSELKLKEEIIKRNKEYDEMQKLLELKNSLTSYDFGKTTNDHIFHHHYHDFHKHRSKSREIIVHDCNRSRPTSRSSSRERHRSSSSASHRRRSRSKSKSRMLRQSIKLVEPKVKCWNYNCRHDENIY